jgi:biopolymer transport protein ExbB
VSLFDFAIKFFQDSGVAIYFSIAIMAVGLSIAIERYIFLSRARAANRRLWEQMLPMLQGGKFKDVHHVVADSDAAIGKIVANGIQRMQNPCRREDIDAAMEEGLIKGFTAVAAVNPAEKAEMLSASISIAMNNTAFALAVAIPFLLIHAFLQARTSEIVDGLEAAKISFLNLVQRLRADHFGAHTH